MDIVLKRLEKDGSVDHAGELPEEARAICAQSAKRHASIPWGPPWTGYLAFEGDVCVGTCAFVTPPADGKVEIAYYTFPAHEGRGVATAMARALIGIAQATDASVRIIAHTLPTINASTHILRSLGFEQLGVAHDPDEGPVWEWHLRAP